MAENFDYSKINDISAAYHQADFLQYILQSAQRMSKSIRVGAVYYGAIQVPSLMTEQVDLTSTGLATGSLAVAAWCSYIDDRLDVVIGENSDHIQRLRGIADNE